MTSKKAEALAEKLLQRGRSPASASIQILPVSEMPMVLTLDQLRPNPDNPRTTRNPKYDEIKASIRARGLDSVPKVTKNPESSEDVYIFSDGGNTRYRILLELWQETQDQRFQRIQCIFKPWPGRLQCVIGHLAENDVRGDLLFIEKAQGVAKAKSIYEEQIGKAISQRELETFLRKEGYPVSQSSISRMEYALDNLFPYMPNLFNSGIGRPQVVQLITLRTAAQKAWDVFSADCPVSNTFDEVFSQVCRVLDDPDYYTLEALQDELIAALLQAMPSPEITYDRWLIELDPQEQNRRKLFGTSSPLSSPISDNDKGAEINDAEKIPASDTPSSTITPPDVVHQPDTPDKARTTPKEHSPQSKQRKEEQLDLYDHENESRESTLPVTFQNAANEIQPASPQDEQQPALEIEATESSVSLANTGLELAIDIWHISPLHNNIKHLQNMAFRLAFELAEAFDAEREICENNLPGSVGYRLQANVPPAYPITQTLVGLTGDTAVSLSVAELKNMLFGTENVDDLPLLDDAQVLKFLRLIRVIRRLREVQRQSLLNNNGGELE